MNTLSWPACNLRRGFTLMETLVIIGILVVLLSIFVPYGLSIRESNRRVTCADNLRQIRNALQSYAGNNGSDFPRVVYDSELRPYGYSAFTGADDENPFAAGSKVHPNDVTASLWLLVRTGLVPETRVFVCPSSGDRRDLMTDAFGRLVKPAQRGNFRRPDNLSYSYASPFSSAPGFRMNDTKPSEFALMADKNPGADATQLAADAAPLEMSRANSLNHRRAGQNVLFADGSVAFWKTPYCGVGRTDKAPGDNIYTARASRSTTQAMELPVSVTGVIGRDVSPIRNDDSYLIPIAGEPVSADLPAVTSAPSTTQAATAPQ